MNLLKARLGYIVKKLVSVIIIMYIKICHTQQILYEEIYCTEVGREREREEKKREEKKRGTPGGRSQTRGKKPKQREQEVRERR